MASTWRRPARRTGAAFCAAPQAPRHSSRTEMRRERPRLWRANPAPRRSAGSLTPHVSVSRLDRALATVGPELKRDRPRYGRRLPAPRDHFVRRGMAPICPARKRPFLPEMPTLRPAFFGSDRARQGFPPFRRRFAALTRAMRSRWPGHLSERQPGPSLHQSSNLLGSRQQVHVSSEI